MAEIMGPVSTLPGFTGYSLPDGAMCDDHPDRPAIARVQTETDSFGCELADMCQECLAGYREERRDAYKGTCDWCKKDVTTLGHARDYDEGLYGPVYRVCRPCRGDAEAERELDESGWYDDYDEGEP
jgi:hypothetical protein